MNKMTFKDMKIFSQKAGSWSWEEEGWEQGNHGVLEMGGRGMNRRKTKSSRIT